jgi:CheY-like chemotaxis protein
MPMDLSDLPASPSPAGTRAAAFAGELGAADGFRELVAQLGREIALPMTSALERINAFATSGRIDRAGLRALREEVECARRIGLSAQQLSRFASGRVRQNHERLNLTQALRDVLAQRGRETAARGIDLRQDLQPAEIVIDASMCTALLQSLLDWSFEHARSHIEFAIDLKTWPVHARLACRFAYIPADEAPPQDAADGRRLDTIPWQLLQRLAQTLGLVLQREDSSGNTRLVLEFPRTVTEGVTTLPTLEFDEPAAAGPNSQPMVGRHVLVVASRRETRNSVRETLRNMGLMVDYVGSVDEARQFCSSGLPHAIVFEAGLAGDNFRRLRAEWTREVPTLAFIEIAEQGRELQVSDLGGQRTSRIGRDVIVSALPSALMFELAKAG